MLLTKEQWKDRKNDLKNEFSEINIEDYEKIITLEDVKNFVYHEYFEEHWESYIERCMPWENHIFLLRLIDLIFRMRNKS